MNQQQQPINNNVKIISYCPLCNTKFNLNNAHIVDERDDGQMIHITCSKCKTSILAVILMNQMGVSSIGLITDLERAEVVKFKEKKSITSDEVIEFHKMLKTKDLTKILNI